MICIICDTTWLSSLAPRFVLSAAAFYIKSSFYFTPLRCDMMLTWCVCSAQLRVKGRASRGVAERLCWAPGQSFRSVIIWCVYSEKSHRPSARRRVWCPTLFIVGIIRGRMLWHDDGEDDGHPVLLLIGPIVCVVIRRQTCRSSVESCFM